MSKKPALRQFDTLMQMMAGFPDEQSAIDHCERIVFSEETNTSQYLKLVANGDLDDNLLEVLEDFIKPQRKRLGTQH